LSATQAGGEQRSETAWENSHQQNIHKGKWGRTEETKKSGGEKIGICERRGGGDARA